ncbi:heterokaryon incompatibility protein 6, OR allele [Aspergillus udagawae]|nr:heterokaryon incompatibility protein 6, OR allele [Aspergillus udagawae]
MVRYQYIPLPPIGENGQSPAFTRVLTLYPGTEQDPLYCTLDIVDIEHCPSPPEALSYVWGSERAPVPLYCGNGLLGITLNLDIALRHLRLPHARRRLWVDAVCINQDDLRERERQVGYMRLVYKHAIAVIAWLGPGMPETKEAFDFARRLSELQKDMNQNATSASDGRTLYSMKTEANNILLESLTAEPRATDALARLFAGQYFERVWCIQEAVASQRCIAKCGQHEMGFFDLISLMTYVCNFRGAIMDAQGLDYPDGTVSFWSTFVSARREVLVSSKQQYVEGSIGRMFNLLAGIRNFKCTDPRDRIFALLGISDEGLQPVLALTQVEGARNSRALSLLQRGAIWLSEKVNSLGPNINFLRPAALRPNYSRPVREVYRDFTRFSVRQQPRKLDILSLVQHTTYPLQDHWPSWVPKLHEERSVSLLAPGLYLAGIPMHGHYRYFAELHDSPLDGRSVEPDVLQLDGYRVDLVDAVSDLIHYKYTEKPPIEAIWSQLFNFPLFPRPGFQYTGTSESLDVAFLQTIGAAMLGVTGMFINQPASWENSRLDAWDALTRQVKSNILAWLQAYPPAQGLSYPDLVPEGQSADLPGDEDAYTHSIWLYSRKRRMYRTRSGLVGLGPQMMQSGDQVVVLFGGSLPFILRPLGREWLLIGDTYLHHDWILQGKQAEMVRSSSGASRVETFRLA